MLTIAELLIHAFGSSKLDHCNAPPYGLPDRTSRMLLLDSSHLQESMTITPILLIIGFQWILHHFKILFITTRHSTTWHHCTYPICLNSTLHWVNYIDHLDIFLLCGITQKDMVQDPSLWQPQHCGMLCHMTLKIVLVLSTFNKDLKKPFCCHFSTDSFSEFLQRFVGVVKCLWTLRY